MEKIKVGIIGATGMVGQNFIRLLNNHPWFQVTYLAASPRSAGKKYIEAVAGRWVMDTDIPESVKHLVVGDANIVEAAKPHCSLVFSAIDLDKQATRDLEEKYARLDLPVVSNNSAHRGTPDVPMMIPEVNPAHIDIIPIQRKNRGWNKGFIVVKPNCSLQSYMTPIYALMAAGYPVESMIITTLQAVSGAGYPGPASIDLFDNFIPFIKGEEEKSEREPLKILGRIEQGKIIEVASPKISAHCNRVAVTDGHTACVSVKFAGKKPAMQDVLNIWKTFKSVPQELQLPFAPEQPIIYRDEPDRPQPRKDRNADKAMAVVVGRLRECPVMDYRFVALSHNTIRGAAGGAILSAELAKAKGYL